MSAKKIILWPLSLLYGMGISIRNQMFNWGVLKTHHFKIPIICIGNITVGGTGKTPHTEALISVLKDKYRIACLSRGYKRKTSGFILSDEHATADEIGDEPMQIKNKFPDITVAVDSNRVRAINKLLQLSSPPEIIIMDDGFQHRHVKADINILLVDYNRPIYEDYLLPLGRLREYTSALERANYIIITKCPSSITPIEKRIILKNLNLRAYQNLLFTTMRYGAITPLDGSSNCTLSPQSTVICVTGIAQPEPYWEYLEKISGEVVRLAYPDHHYFRSSDIQRITNEYQKKESPDTWIFTTEKDAVRLMNVPFPEEIRKRIFYIPVEPDFLTSKEGLLKNIYDYVKKDKSK